MTDSADTIQKYRQILELDPGSRVFALLAEELCAAGQWEEAAQVCKKGLPFHPDHLVAQMLLGQALMEMGDPHESERVLLNAVGQIRENSIVFKLLCDLAAMAGKTEIAAEYSRIYEAFRNTAPASETEGPDLAAASAQEASEWDDFKAEAIEDLDVEAHDVHVGAAEAAGQTIGFAQVLEHLAQRLAGHLTKPGEPGDILSEGDRYMLKKSIVEILGSPELLGAKQG